jgi:hypothetical protein
MLPDYIYLLLLVVLLSQGILAWRDLPSLSPTTFMAYLPQYPWALKIDLIGHSAIIWGVAYLLALVPVYNKMQAFIVGWGTHIFIDGITHAAHANFFLYPLSLLAVHSPVSYWEPEYFAWEFHVVNGSMMGAVTIYLIYHWWKKRRKGEQ